MIRKEMLFRLGFTIDWSQCTGNPRKEPVYIRLILKDTHPVQALFPTQMVHTLVKGLTLGEGYALTSDCGNEFGFGV